ncbi:HlyD family secretion protein (plasmid) [Lichenicola cladoniae]|uniref:HlyD family secretion protein n=1 Tax=Lichenicola cladoniae TaxID=1484109 RepID=A0A6M8HXW6_9PROT|nr:HlyD family secretion protein [Lichenicola cladoniae]NPD70249.1 HlyD family secretion protein [Acetobacteraceae bacterium]QKE93373.1 HlyD family secretion protein [Lichenicola cladoniae]
MSDQQLLPRGLIPVDDTARLPPVESPPSTANAPTAEGWLWALLRIALIAAAAGGAWFIANNWDRWTGASRLQRTDDAYLVGDLTPLSAKVAGYLAKVEVQDFATVSRGQILAEIEPSDYRAALAQAQATAEAAAAILANIANQKVVQRALIRQAGAAIVATSADVIRSHLEAVRQKSLLTSGLAGTLQVVERAEADEKRFAAQMLSNVALLDQQKAILDSLDIQQRQLAAQCDAAEAQVTLAENNLSYTQIRSPVDGMAGQRQVRPGQFINVGSQIVTVMPLPKIWVIANYKETQMTHIRAGQSAHITVDAFPDLLLTGHVASWSPGTGSTFALLAPDNATGNFTKVVQRMPVKIVLDAVPALGTLVRPGMSVEAEIDTADRQGAMRAANTGAPLGRAHQR